MIREAGGSVRVLPKRAVTAVVAATMLLAGCGGGETDVREPPERAGGAGAGSPSVSGTASPGTGPAAMSPAEARADIRAGLAAGGFETPRFAEPEANGIFGACAVTALVPTTVDPDPKNTARLADELKDRGRVQEKFWASDGMQTLSLRKAPWTLDVLGGTLPKEHLAADLPEEQRADTEDFTGLFVSAADRACMDQVHASQSP